MNFLRRLSCFICGVEIEVFPIKVKVKNKNRQLRKGGSIMNKSKFTESQIIGYLRRKEQDEKTGNIKCLTKNSPNI